MYQAVATKLASGELVILDGGMGTHIQTLGAPMDDATWCAKANLTHPQIVRAAHADYIRAGAEVIIANTYASSPVLFEVLGRSSEIADIDRTAINLARQAVDEFAEGPIAIAGSMSVMRQVIAGSDRTEFPDVPRQRIVELMKMKADVLAEAGCDLIVLEMLRDTDLSLYATEAAVETGLPVWAGISVERRDDGRLAGFDDRRWTLEDIVSVIMAAGPVACCVMHNDIRLTTEAVEIVESIWAGPVGAYNESVVFKMPNWEFGDIEPDEFAETSKTWRRAGASILGGCCGIGPEHIKALHDTYHPN